MCGRYVVVQTDQGIAAELRSELTVGPELPPRYNIAPTTEVRIAVERPAPDDPDGDPVRHLRTVRWGLVPWFSPDGKPSAKMINARAETITERPAYRRAAERRRCLVPASGYFEWQPRAAGPKQPYYLHPEADGLVAFAGLYELWRPKDSDDPDAWLWTMSIVTTQATDTLGEIHDRSPLIIPPDLWDAWLSSGLTDPADVRSLIAQVPEPHLVPRPVSRAVNSVRNDGPGLIEAV